MSSLYRHFRAISNTIGSEIVKFEQEHEDLGRRFALINSQKTELRAALGQILEQAEQMRGLFPDTDGAIARAVIHANEVLEQTKARV